MTREHLLINYLKSKTHPETTAYDFLGKSHANFSSCSYGFEFHLLSACSPVPALGLRATFANPFKNNKKLCR